ncbi:GerAB/ArcD/ProY family transporter [Tepidibacter formicigenes]|jgi:spore germination protein|uniref:Spore germination protein n=1 Tax=Tepidibacter formicigenes DSM 15518 TaxID=1123349 RepID=A0A1M6MB21_9FIRM|nr:endospore germination permease [Tepidibacter formicigenes]SHJ80651.1 spore germination protein [Tepidibacter formicigenes DSM 15518]
MNESLTNRQIAFVIFGVIVGYGIMSLPKNIAENIGTGAWIVLIGATGIAVIFTYVFTYLAYIHKNKTLCEYSEILTGKFISRLIVFIYTVEFFLFSSLVIRAASEVIKLNILLKTPIWSISLLFFIVIYYAVIKGLRVVGRICELYGFVIIIIMLFTHILLFTQGELINLKPFILPLSIKTYIKASVTTVIPLLGIEVIAFIPFDKNNNKKVFKYGILMTIFIGFLYILVVESCISVMGVDTIINYHNALLATIRRVDIEQLQFFRRLDGFVLLIWIMAVFTTATLFSYGTSFFASKCFNVEFKIITPIVIILSFIVSLIPKTTMEVRNILDYIGYLAIINGGVIPLILLIITKVRRYDKKI